MCIQVSMWGLYSEHSVGFQQDENFKAEVSERVKIIPDKVKGWGWEKGSVREREKVRKSLKGKVLSQISFSLFIAHAHTVYMGQGKYGKCCCLGLTKNKY